MSARYLAWLGLKLVVATALVIALYAFASATLFRSESLNSGFDKVPLTFDGVILGMWMLPLLWVGLVYLCVLDQRYRCPVCARRLRMPLEQGSRSDFLLNHPGTEYVCPYGHGKLLVQLWVSMQPPHLWTRYGDIWQELFRGPRR